MVGSPCSPVQSLCVFICETCQIQRLKSPLKISIFNELSLHDRFCNFPLSLRHRVLSVYKSTYKTVDQNLVQKNTEIRFCLDRTKELLKDISFTSWGLPNFTVIITSFRSLSPLPATLTLSVFFLLASFPCQWALFRACAAGFSLLFQLFVQNRKVLK